MRNYAVSIIFSIFFAILLWLIVNLQGDYEVEFSIPFVVKNIPDDMAIKSNYPDSVHVKLYGSGWNFLLMYFSGNHRVSLDLSDAERNLFVHLMDNPRVSVSIPRGLEILSISPEMIKIEFDKKVVKKVPVELDADIVLPAGYGIVGNPELDPDSIEVSGARIIVSKIKLLRTERIKIEDRREDFIGEVNIYNPYGKLVHLSSMKVNVRIKIQQIVEQEFLIPVEVRSLPEGREVILFPEKVKVIVRGGIDNIATLRDTLIKAFVDYNDILRDRTGLIRPEVSLPEDITLIGIRPEGLEYIIRQK
jgi:YbbR domain-containing protein